MLATHLIIISDRTALSWVLTEQRMAFPARRARSAHTLQQGDEVMLYSTRSCFGNPTRDLGRVLGLATVTTGVRVLDAPVRFGEREFTEGCGLRIDGLTPFRTGVHLRDFVDRLAVFPDPASWSVRMRRAYLPLPPPDADLLRARLVPLLQPYAEAVDGYEWPPSVKNGR